MLLCLKRNKAKNISQSSLNSISISFSPPKQKAIYHWLLLRTPKGSPISAATNHPQISIAAATNIGYLGAAVLAAAEHVLKFDILIN